MSTEEIEVIEDEDKVDASAWTSFPFKVFKMIARGSLEHPAVIRWVENGGAFFIDYRHPPSALTPIVQKYFPDFDYPAFERRLKKFGWVCEEGLCYHPYFHRDRLDSIEFIERTLSPAIMHPSSTPPWRRNGRNIQEILRSMRSASVKTSELSSLSLTTQEHDEQHNSARLSSSHQLISPESVTSHRVKSEEAVKIGSAVKTKAVVKIEGNASSSPRQPSQKHNKQQQSRRPRPEAECVVEVVDLTEPAASVPKTIDLTEPTSLVKSEPFHIHKKRRFSSSKKDELEEITSQDIEIEETREKSNPKLLRNWEASFRLIERTSPSLGSPRQIHFTPKEGSRDEPISLDDIESDNDGVLDDEITKRKRKSKKRRDKQKIKNKMKIRLQT